MNDTRITAVADVYAGDTAPATGSVIGTVFTYAIRTEVEPDVLARVAGLCNLANVTPWRVSLAREDQFVAIEIMLDGISTATAESIRRKLLQLTCVASVEMTERG